MKTKIVSGIKWGASKADLTLIAKIITRASGAFPKFDRMTMAMDLEACHRNGNPMDFAALVAADDCNFAHDVCGITRHIDRETGKLGGCFSPRFSKR